MREWSRQPKNFILKENLRQTINTPTRSRLSSITFKPTLYERCGDICHLDKRETLHLKGFRIMNVTYETSCPFEMSVVTSNRALLSVFRMRLSVQSFCSAWDMFADTYVDGFFAVQPRAPISPTKS
ncbi:hypothetical protein EVAR_47048_1 [Eumeta japonica]|uniref:Uncharacterized protein n=1 Tax=Eumeta variegata TaxID=151549 RepID=A0A4C1ZSS3_EUMVA|nr:hypothetical protein EVAR_47048_1 [Eumeta japonica]